MIRQEVVVPAQPATVYAALTEGARFSALTGAPAEIDARDGGAFACFGGMILGRQIELVPGERIVQAWRVKLWEPGVFSLVRFDLRADGAGTRATLTHAAFPEGQGEHLAKGWHTNYWEPLAKLGPV
jgi:activator of HSP90 ATPase